MSRAACLKAVGYIQRKQINIGIVHSVKGGISIGIGFMGLIYLSLFPSQVHVTHIQSKVVDHLIAKAKIETQSVGVGKRRLHIFIFDRAVIKKDPPSQSYCSSSYIFCTEPDQIGVIVLSGGSSSGKAKGR